jgi:hypothetical protein
MMPISSTMRRRRCFINSALTADQRSVLELLAFGEPIGRLELQLIADAQAAEELERCWMVLPPTHCVRPGGRMSGWSRDLDIQPIGISIRIGTPRCLDALIKGFTHRYPGGVADPSYRSAGLIATVAEFGLSVAGPGNAVEKHLGRFFDLPRLTGPTLTMRKQPVVEQD